jgi:hypothetical protein
LRFITLFNARKSLTHRTRPSFLGMTKVGERYSAGPVRDNTPISTRRSSSNLKTRLFLSGTGYGR